MFILDMYIVYLFRLKALMRGDIVLRQILGEIEEELLTLEDDLTYWVDTNKINQTTAERYDPFWRKAAKTCNGFGSVKIW